MSKLKLRNYQQENVEFFKEHGQMYLNDDTGLGKTITMFAAHRAIGGKLGLFITAKFLLDDVYSKNKEFFQDDVMIYTGTKKQRASCWEAYVQYPEGMKYLVTNYANLQEIVTYCEEHNFWPWDTVFFDEVHLNQAGLLAHKSDKYLKSHSKSAVIYAKKLMKKVPHAILSTATPMRQNIGDYFTPLHLLDPKKFRSYYSFIYKYGIVVNGPYGIEVERRPASIKTFRDLLDNYRIRHVLSEVQDELLPVTSNVIPLQMSKLQKKYYTELQEDMWIVDEDTEDIAIIASNHLARIIRQRQLLNSPRLFDLNDDGTALEYLRNDIQSLPADASIAIFVPFRNTTKAIAKMLYTMKLPNFWIGMGGDPVSEIAKEFNASKACKKIWIGTIDSAIGYDLNGISNMYFIGAHDSPIMNQQAEGRALGLRQSRAILIKYLLYKGTVHADLLQRLVDKKSAIDWVNMPKKLFSKEFRKN